MRLRDRNSRHGLRTATLSCCALALAAYMVVLFAAVPALAQTDVDRTLEQRVKAAFLHRFTEFTTWPDYAFARPDAPFVIAVAGREGIADELRNITAARRVAGRPIEVKRVSDVDGLGTVHMLFIAESEKARLRDWLRAAPRPTLVVTESDAALPLGTVINFIIVDGRVRFEISLDAAEKRGLRLSSRLLAVAQNVRSGQP